MARRIRDGQKNPWGWSEDSVMVRRFRVGQKNPWGLSEESVTVRRIRYTGHVLFIRLVTVCVLLLIEEKLKMEEQHNSTCINLQSRTKYIGTFQFFSNFKTSVYTKLPLLRPPLTMLANGPALLSNIVGKWSSIA